MNGQAWKDMRAFLSPTFTSGRIRRMFPHFEKSAKNLENHLFSQPTSGKGVDILVNEAMRKYTVDVICAAAFGMNSDVFSNEESEFLKMSEKLANFSLSRKIRFGMSMCFPKIMNFLKISFLDKDVATYFSGVLKTVLRSRESNFDRGIKNSDDFLQLLVEGKRGGLQMDESELNKEEKEAQLSPEDANKNNIVWSEDIAISQSFIFLVAGFDGIANTLALAVHQLAEHPEIQEKVFQEVVEICGTGMNSLTYENVNAMQYLDNVVSETLRLFSLFRLERKCMLDYNIPGSTLVIPKGTMVLFPVEAIHRDEKYWPNPLEFNPDRFNAQNKAGRNSYAYMPFGIGPRNCIGMRFATIETKAAIANVVKNFEIALMEESLGPVRDVFGYRIPSSSKIRLIPRK